VALTAIPEMVFESGRVKIKAPIASEANLGPYTIRVQAEAPNHLSGTLEPPTISGALAVGGREYKYSADIELKAEVIWHIRPKVGPELVKVPVPHQPVVLEKSSTDTINWKEAAVGTGKVVVTVVIVAAAATVGWELALIALAGAALIGASPAFSGHSVLNKSFTHTLDIRRSNQ
jgi:hypothetical protein